MFGDKDTYPLVSVLISAYNRPNTLRTALSSALNQTYPNYEVILIRDGGQPLKEAILPFLDNPRLRFIDRDINRGKAYSFNEALQYAKGEYVCYLDDDDLFYPFHIEVLAAALKRNEHIGAVYSDLYKVHCRASQDGWRLALAKNVEISRDFDRMLLLQFNNVLHVSLMHRRCLFEKTGLYNENIRVLIDWDLTRRLCFFTDFLHIPIVTGEFYAPVEDCDRISVQQRKSITDYLANVMSIRAARPLKPWDKVADLAVIAPYGTVAERQSVLRAVWGHSFYPCQYYLPIRPSEQGKVDLQIPNLIQIVAPQQATPEQCAALCLRQADAPFAAIVSHTIQIDSDQGAFLERSLYPLLNESDPTIAYELVEYDGGNAWGGVCRTDILYQAIDARKDIPIRQALERVGIKCLKPRFEQYPFVFDTYLMMADQHLKEGDWRSAVKIYDYLAKHFGNRLWVDTLKSYAYYCGAQYTAARQVVSSLNRHFPTVARLHLEGKIHQKLKDYKSALDCYQRALAIVEGKSFGLAGQQAIAALSMCLSWQNQSDITQEQVQWTH